MVKNKKLQEIELALNSLVIFRKLLSNEVIVPLRQMLDTEVMDPLVQLQQYAEFVSRLFSKNPNLTRYILNLVLEDENFYVIRAAKGEPSNEMLDACLVNELKILERLGGITPREMQKEVSYYGILPEWETENIDFTEIYTRRLANIRKYGYGLFSRGPMFTLNGGRLELVRHPDPIALNELFGYEAQREELIANTRALLEGRPAQNALLYGDAGTGKSSSVKAIVNEFSMDGLRLIQVGKDQISEIPRVIDRVMDNPLKFILFIDDLSFSAGDDVFNRLKATLEGSVAARPQNLVIYATSNRRHLLREQFSDRDGDDIHRGDTMQEQLSLSARFGLRVNFQRPTKDEYLRIVSSLAEQYAIDSPTLSEDAEAFALQCGGRSPRAARQFIDTLRANVRDPEQNYSHEHKDPEGKAYPIESQNRKDEGALKHADAG